MEYSCWKGEHNEMKEVESIKEQEADDGVDALCMLR